MDTILGPGSYFNPDAETNEKIGGKIPNGKFYTSSKSQKTEIGD